MTRKFRFWPACTFERWIAVPKRASWVIFAAGEKHAIGGKHTHLRIEVRQIAEDLPEHTVRNF